MKKMDSVIIFQRLASLGKSPLHQKSESEGKKIRDEFMQNKKNRSFLPGSLVMVDAPNDRLHDRSWYFRRAQLFIVDRYI